MEPNASSFSGGSPGVPIRHGWVTLEPERAGEVPLRCWCAEPREGPPRGGLLVLPEIFGVNPWVRTVTDRFAARGTIALAVPLFARTAPELSLGYGPQDVQNGRAHKERTTAATLLLDVARAQRWLFTRLPPERKGAIGCVGFCFGGHVALLASSLEGMAASCVCYGAGVVQGRPGGGPPSLEALDQARGRVLFIYGLQDPLMPPEDLRAITTAVERARQGRGEEWARLRTFAAGHGFLCEAREDFQPAEAEAAWAAIEAFMDAHLLR